VKKRTCIPCYSKQNQRMDMEATNLMKQGKIQESNTLSLVSLIYLGKRLESCGRHNFAEIVNRKVNYLMNGVR